MGQETASPGKHGGAPQTTQRFEEEIYRLQRAQIRLLYGKKASQDANYGWAVGADEGYTSISTKIYNPMVILTTIFQTDIEPEGL
jgi:hypothetical protein